MGGIYEDRYFIETVFFVCGNFGLVLQALGTYWEPICGTNI
jgi:hypothetical protein